MDRFLKKNNPSNEKEFERNTLKQFWLYFSALEKTCVPISCIVASRMMTIQKKIYATCEENEEKI
jgi:hypothetical protein